MATSGGHMDFMLGGARVVSFWIRYCKTLIQHWCNIWYCKVFFLYKLTLLQPDNGVVGRCQSVCPGGVRHVTITHDALHFTVQAPLLTWDHHWRPVQTCPFHLTVQDPLRPPKYWHLVATEARTVGQYVSYWIAFFFTGCICNFLKKN